MSDCAACQCRLRSGGELLVGEGHQRRLACLDFAEQSVGFWQDAGHEEVGGLDLGRIEMGFRAAGIEFALRQLGLLRPQPGQAGQAEQAQIGRRRCRSLLRVLAAFAGQPESGLLQLLEGLGDGNLFYGEFRKCLGGVGNCWAGL